MSICCKAIRQIYYNAGSGYTVASYMTNEDLPEEVKKQKNGNYGIFQAFGTELSDERRPGCGTGRLKNARCNSGKKCLVKVIH